MVLVVVLVSLAVDVEDKTLVDAKVQAQVEVKALVEEKVKAD
jgi:hypothetical protein